MDRQRFMQPWTQAWCGGIFLPRDAQDHLEEPCTSCPAGAGQSILWLVPAIPGQAGSELASSSPAVRAGGIGGYMAAFIR